MDTHKTKVIFRVFNSKYRPIRNLEIIAIFPEVPGTYDAGTCEAYVRDGQHIEVDAAYIQRHRLATPEEYAPLKEELERIGYNLDVKTRSCHAYFQARRKALKYRSGNYNR